ncbi:hypothetical protein J699_03288 [Acinetobacter sp. 1000160]|nr:hypothetical protein J522_1197 [Acinetobacter baumannii 146457]EYT15807.1 hypothetical protein J699_03288 [Acinetobacter sp. 1000160]
MLGAHIHILAVSDCLYNKQPQSKIKMINFNFINKNKLLI